MVNLLIITHGSFGGYLLEAAEGIVGPQRSGVVFVGVSSRVPVEEMSAKFSRTLESLSGSGGVLVLSDMVGGTPMNLALPLIKDRDDVELVTGVNLYMLVSALTHRANLPVGELREKVLGDAKRSCADVKALFQASLR